MAEKVKIPRRLGKAAAEFNVGSDTIVNFLSKKGHEIKDEPNAKLTEEMYTLLVAEYQKEKDIKEKSSELARKTEASEEEPPVMKKKDRDVEPIASGEIFIKDMQLRRPEEDGPELIRTEIPRPKVVKKIDLGDEKPKRRKAAVKKVEEVREETVETAVETSVNQEVPISGAEAEPVVEQLVETAVEVTEAAEAPQTEVPVEKESVAAEEVREKKAEELAEAATEEAVPAEEPSVAETETETPAEEAAAPAEEPEKNKVEVFSLAKNVSIPKLKTIGHINLDELDQSTKPKKKTKEERRKEKEARNAEQRKKQKEAKKSAAKAAEPAAQVQPAAEESKADNFLKTEYTRLKGPKVISKIDLDEGKSKHEGTEAGGDGEGGKKKRKRIKATYSAGDNAVPSYGEKEKTAKSKSKDKKSGKYKVDFTEEDITEQIRKTYSGMAPVKKSQASKHRKEKREHIQQEMMEEMERNEQEKSVLKVTEFITANELAIMMNKPVIDIISVCMSLGLAVAINQRLSAETISLLAENYGYTVQFVGLEEEEEKAEENPEDLVPRAPIITVMGHVDHGKTSLLDYIRKSNVIAGEAGGITQHIGAYSVKLEDGRRITFLDTPGHEAFTAMRARGAQLTDLAIIIVAADDAVMPQTVEAINHAQAAGVPMVFAINKIDKPGANPDTIRRQLSEMNILVEDWGGKYQCQEISAKHGLNVDKLLEKVLLETDLLELKANPDKLAVGAVIESSLDKGRGYLATVLVQEGTLHQGDVMLCGSFYGRIKSMFNERGQKITEAGPSTPVSVLGLNGAPAAGEKFNVLADEKEAKSIAAKREQLIRIQGIKTQKHMTLEEIGRRIAIGNFKELNIIVKGDVDGSVEALSDSLIKLSTEEVRVNVIHKAVGGISESDVLLAEASDAVIVGFQVRPSVEARKAADKEGIEIRLYSVIYDCINEVKDGIEGMLEPEKKEEVTATAEVKQTFHISKVGTIAGCIMRDGKMVNKTKIRLIRDGIVVYTGDLGSLQIGKDQVKEVPAGKECGMSIAGYNDIKEGDMIEAYQIVEIKRTL